MLKTACTAPHATNSVCDSKPSSCMLRTPAMQWYRGNRRAVGTLCGACQCHGATHTPVAGSAEASLQSPMRKYHPVCPKPPYQPLHPLPQPQGSSASASMISTNPRTMCALHVSVQSHPCAGKSGVLALETPQQGWPGLLLLPAPVWSFGSVCSSALRGGAPLVLAEDLS